MLRRPPRSRKTGIEGSVAGAAFPAGLHCAFVLTAAMLCCACGLEVYDNLAAINPDQISFSTTYVTFKHNLANSGVSFLGYDLYYRLFNLSEAAQIAPMRQQIEALYISSIGQITGNYGFRRIVSSIQDVPPYIDLSGALNTESITVKLDFGYLISAATDDDPYISVTKDSDNSVVVQKSLGRYVVPNLKTFRENGFLNSDYDLPTSLLGSNLVGANLVVCILVVANGYDQTRSQSLVSQAVFLANPGLGNGGIFQIQLTL
jgi:hypothetical protein